ncbi:MAG TPA: glycosyltransferase family 39 protein [bacterium]|nr:glycosyltransferase family 39 protein [bacterium]
MKVWYLKSSRHLFWIVLVVALVVRLPFLFFTADDAFITYRHVTNLLSGDGLVYNPGELVLGASSPLYAMALAALGLGGLDFILWGKLLGIVAGSLACVLLYRILRCEVGEETALLAGLLGALSPYLVVWSASGMETGTALLLALLTIDMYRQNKMVPTGIFLGLSILTRFDAGLLGFVLCCHYGMKERRFPIELIASACSVVTPWLAFSLAYYGMLLPNSLVAKFLVYKGTSEVTPLVEKLGVFFGKPDKFGFSLLVIWGYIRIFRTKKTSLFLLGFWSLLHLCSLLLSEGCMFAWYYCPVFPGYVALGAWGVVDLCDRFASRVRQHPKTLFLATLLFLVLLQSFRLIHSWKLHQEIQAEMTQVHKQIGLWLKDKSQPKDTILVGDIGYIGYYSERHILDWMGLVSPKVIPYHKNGIPEKVVLDFRPEYIVLGEYDYLFPLLTNQNWFSRMYQQAQVFSEGSQVYHIWEMRSNDPGGL